LTADHRDKSSSPVTTIAALNIHDREISGTEPFRVYICTFAVSYSLILYLKNFFNFCLSEPTVLVSGNDFYAFPRIDPSGKRVAWIEWSDPNMSWDKSQLWVGYFSEKG